MRKWILGFVLISVCSISTDANAWRLFRRRGSSNTTYSSQANVGGSYQAQAQYKANLMASQRRMSHGVSSLVAGYEGIGMGTSRNCSTCTPRGRMTLVADAAAQSSNGMWYRVRAWK